MSAPPSLNDQESFNDYYCAHTDKYDSDSCYETSQTSPNIGISRNLLMQECKDDCSTLFANSYPQILKQINESASLDDQQSYTEAGLETDKYDSDFNRCESFQTTPNPGINRNLLFANSYLHNISNHIPSLNDRQSFDTCYTRYLEGNTGVWVQSHESFEEIKFSGSVNAFDEDRYCINTSDSLRLLGENEAIVNEGMKHDGHDDAIDDCRHTSRIEADQRLLVETDEIKIDDGKSIDAEEEDRYCIGYSGD